MDIIDILDSKVKDTNIEKNKLKERIKSLEHEIIKYKENIKTLETKNNFYKHTSCNFFFSTHLYNVDA